MEYEGVRSIPAALDASDSAWNLYGVWCVDRDAVSRVECSEHYQTKVSNSNRIINCDPNVIQKRLNILALKD
jgi:hypothetical protein